MNKELEGRQIREARSLLQKAGQRNAPQEIKREALLRLIGLVHTSSPNLKVFAAQHFNQYFKDFPDLEEQVIHSVYDICEDVDSQVRIEGYKAIVSLSVESRKWTKRNTDVLVQLLQSDEPKELQEIEEALLRHIDLDPVAAIGVLCDNCMLDPDQPREEQIDRTRLRKLVLLFMANKAKNHILKHFEPPESAAEKIYRDGLLKTIPDADLEETEMTVKNLLLPLRSFSSQSEQGDDLLRVLLDKTKSIYTELKTRPGPFSLDPVKPYLSLLDLIAIVKQVANPAPLLRFYSLSLIGKMALQKLEIESQIDIIHRLSGILDICEEQRLKNEREQLVTRPVNWAEHGPELETINGKSSSTSTTTGAQTINSLIKEIRADSEKRAKSTIPDKPTSLIGQKRKSSPNEGSDQQRIPQPSFRSKSNVQSSVKVPNTQNERQVRSNSLLNRLQVDANTTDRVANSGITKRMEHVTISSSQPKATQGISIKGAATKGGGGGQLPPATSNPTLMDRLAQAEHTARRKRRK
ncbi:hypothetical protein Clacol_000382 [Clathrus columnatus]|uniref:Apoptosis inhibitor 5 n=1 Tax=Clathrus columnatus TaxID=1419009 RepID=A0AAV5A0Q5_9AGAM|nr:hypothetical protein Clacol_000382 [Clathrus columnatus]